MLALSPEYLTSSTRACGASCLRPDHDYKRQHGAAGAPTAPPPSPGAAANVKVAPKIVLFSPAVAKAGAKVTVFGHNFVNVTWVKLAVHARGGTGLSSKAFKVVAKV